MANTVKTIIDRVQLRAAQATTIARKSTLAYVGLHVAAFERVKPAMAAGEKFFGELVVKGEKIEEQAQTQAKDAYAVASVKAGEIAEKVRNIVPVFAANDRVAELETELEVLNKRVKAKAKKKTASVKSAAKVETQKAETKAA